MEPAPHESLTSVSGDAIRRSDAFARLLAETAQPFGPMYWEVYRLCGQFFTVWYCHPDASTNSGLEPVKARADSSSLASQRRNQAVT